MTARPPRPSADLVTAEQRTPDGHEPSRTALLSAVSRGWHRLADPDPWVLDDPYALCLAGPDWPQLHTHLATVFTPPVVRQARAAMVARARYVEDQLEVAPVGQYAVESVLRTVATGAPGTRIVFSYIPPHQFLDRLGTEFLDTLTRLAGQHSEPVHTLLAPDTVEAVVTDCGMHVSEHLTRDDLHKRYFASRSDNLTPPTTQRLVTATVPPVDRQLAGGRHS